VHWLTDVMAGLIVGWSWFFIVAIIFGGRLQRFGDPAVRDPRSLDQPSPADEPTDVSPSTMFDGRRQGGPSPS
jgi:hypothetical protein